MTQKVGIVKWFNDSKGYGFILADEDGQHVLVHSSAITDMKGHRKLTEGAEGAVREGLDAQGLGRQQGGGGRVGSVPVTPTSSSKLITGPWENSGER